MLEGSPPVSHHCLPGKDMHGRKGQGCMNTGGMGEREIEKGEEMR